MPQRNKHGLSRYIPERIKREIRRRCRFGCAICGLAIIEYEHIDPTFSDARIHNPDKMTLLCPTHHSLVTKGLLSKDVVREANESPKAAEAGYSDYIFDLSGEVPVFDMGTNKITPVVNKVLSLNGLPFLNIERPEKRSRKWQLSAIFYGEDKKIFCNIRRNECRFLSDNYDIVQIQNRFSIKDSDNKVAFEFELNPPNTFNLNTIYMTADGNRLTVSNGDLSFENSEKTTGVTFKNCSLSGWGDFTIDDNGLRLSPDAVCEWPAALPNNIEGSE